MDEGHFILLLAASIAWIIFANEKTPRWVVSLAWGVVALAIIAAFQGWL